MTRRSHVGARRPGLASIAGPSGRAADDSRHVGRSHPDRRPDHDGDRTCDALDTDDDNDGLPDILISDDGQDRYLLNQGATGGIANYVSFAFTYAHVGGGSGPASWAKKALAMTLTWPVPTRENE